MNLHFIETAGRFLAVSADERYRRPFVEQLYSISHTLLIQAKAVGYHFREIGNHGKAEKSLSSSLECN